MEFQPVGYRFKVLPDTMEEKTPGGLIIPDVVKDKEQKAAITGTIVAIGDGCWKDVVDGEPWAKVGDRVLFAKYGGIIFKEGEVEFRFLNDQDLIAVQR